MNNNHPLISIVIPVHNTAKYLSECLDSVISQTYKNLEIILVNDDSSDESEKICRDFIEKHSGVKCKKVKHHNAALARRDGIAMATADLVCFCDSDDVINEQYVEYLYKALSENRVEISICNLITTINEEKYRWGRQYSEAKVLNDTLTVFADNYHIDNNDKNGSLIMQSINTKLFDKKLFNNIDYSVIKTRILEDNFILPQIYRNMSNDAIAYIGLPMYYYRTHDDSTMSKVIEKIRYEEKDIYYPELFKIAMEYIINLYKDRNDAMSLVNKIEIKEYYNYAISFFATVSAKDQIISDKAEAIKRANELLRHKDNQITAKEQEISKILNSTNYKIGRRITAPYRWLRRIIK